MPLSDLKLRRSKPDAKAYKITDGGGLYIEIRPSGKKLWRYRYRIAGKENVFAIGEYPEVTLAQARIERDEARAMVRQGLNPAHMRKAERQGNIAESAHTFQSVAEEYAQQKAKSWADYSLKQFRSAMEKNVYPYIGTLPIKQVTAPHIWEIMRKMDDRGATSYAIQVRKWCSAVFRYAASTLRADSDPAAALKGALLRGKIDHARPMAADEIALYLKRLGKFGGNGATKIALELLLLTFVRTVELRRAEWRDVDFKQAQWRIPEWKMKSRKPHIVPLSVQSLTLLKELHVFTGGGPHLFPNTRRPHDVMSATTINRALEYMGYSSGTVSGHDFRATASTRLYEMGYPSAHIEMQLAHSPRDKTAAAYNHAQYLPERTRMMQDWADYVDSLR